LVADSSRAASSLGADGFDGVLEALPGLGRKWIVHGCSRDEILDPRHHPEHAIQTAIEQGLVSIVSPAEAEQATARLAQRWAGANSRGLSRTMAL
jgi:hypothetical protein